MLLLRLLGVKLDKHYCKSRNPTGVLRKYPGLGGNFGNLKGIPFESREDPNPGQFWVETKRENLTDFYFFFRSGRVFKGFLGKKRTQLKKARKHPGKSDMNYVHNHNVHPEVSRNAEEIKKIV